MNRSIDIKLKCNTSITDERIERMIKDAMFDLFWDSEIDYIHILKLTEKDGISTNSDDKK